MGTTIFQNAMESPYLAFYYILDQLNLRTIYDHHKGGVMYQ